jgi:hypothetical protein
MCKVPFTMHSALLLDLEALMDYESSMTVVSVRNAAFCCTAGQPVLQVQACTDVASSTPTWSIGCKATLWVMLGCLSLSCAIYPVEIV